MKNTVKIRITKMEYKRNCENFCNTVLMLRKARNIGDEETVNHYVLSRLNSQKGDKFTDKCKRAKRYKIPSCSFILLL